MKIRIQEPPPNMNEIMKYLPDWKQRVFTYGPVLYNPNGLQIDAGTARHEEHHSWQQTTYKAHGILTIIPKLRVKEWWDRYLKSWAFRLSQEISAYQVQYREYAKVIINPKERERVVKSLAQRLCVFDMDRKLISLKDATNAIISEKDYNFRV